ncbi:MAG TPA: hypothetical protein VGI43_17595, partial [Mucilaginibacter sp.]
MLIVKRCSYTMIAAAMVAALVSCNSTFNTNISPPSVSNAQPDVQPLEFSKPQKIAWAGVKAEPVRLASTKLAWNKLPEQADDTTGFKPFKYPVQETKFD